MNKGRLLIISGPSGAGKGTICKELFKEKDDVVFSVSMTTRKPRPGEIDGKNYYFVSKEEFESKIDADGFLEYASVFENYYGTPKDLVLEELNKGNDVLLEIDIQGAMQIKNVYKEGVFIFIMPPSMKVLEERITGRGTETKDSLKLRLGKALKEIAYIDKYDYAVINDKLEDAVARVKAIIEAEHSKVREDIYKLIEKYKEEE